MANRYTSADPQPANWPARYTALDIGKKIRYLASEVNHFPSRYTVVDVKVNRYTAQDVDDRS